MASNPSRLLLVSAFASVYLIWGSTYLAIRFTIETIPPFLMAAVRFLLAGGILFLWERLKGTPIPGFKKWRTATILGALLLLGGNGGVVWAEQFVPSGLTALLIATEPMWVIILSFLLLRNLSLNRQLFFGLLIGFAGMILLVGPGDLQSENSIDPIGAAVILLAALSWAAGSVYGSRVDLKTTPFMATSMQMLTGGVLLGVFSFANSEWSDFNLNQVSLSSILALDLFNHIWRAHRVHGLYLDYSKCLTNPGLNLRIRQSGSRCLSRLGDCWRAGRLAHDHRSTAHHYSSCVDHYESFTTIDKAQTINSPFQKDKKKAIGKSRRRFEI